jgi:hypothetical protein
VREEIQSKTLKVIAIEGAHLLDTQLMIVELRRRSPNASVEVVKKALEEMLAVGTRHQSRSSQKSAAMRLPHNSSFSLR